jgi:hypothetical protein
MQLDETQRATVTQWIREGMKLSEVQNRILSDFGLKMTYMEVRFLVDDLKVTPVDPEPPPAPKLPEPPQKETPATTADEPPAKGGVSVTVDQLTRPGAMVSGKVVFSDGMGADWYLDEAGRLGIAAKQQGYRPSQADVQQFQAGLQAELAKIGF